MHTAIALRAIPVTAALVALLAPTATSAAESTNEYPPMTIERIDTHREGVVTAAKEKGNALKYVATAKRLDGSVADKDVVVDTKTVVYSPTTGALNSVQRKIASDGTARDWYVKYVSSSKCWRSEDGKTWTVTPVVVRVAEDAGVDGLIVQETLSENSAVLVHPTQPGSVTITLTPNGIQSAEVADFFGQEWEWKTSLSTVKSPKVKAPAKKVTKPADGRIENVLIR